MDQREVVTLTTICWDCLGKIEDVGYSNVYTHFLTDHMDLVRETFREKFPEMKKDWFKGEHGSQTITFDLSDQAFKKYKLKIQEFSSFGSAVKMLGAYDDYVHTVAKLYKEKEPLTIRKFMLRHKLIKKNQKKIKKVRGFIWKNVGRGIKFFEEIFKFKTKPIYELALNFFFELRNINVHQSGRVNEKLLKLVENPLIQNDGNLEEGQIMNWNLTLVLLLNQLLTSLLPSVDPIINKVLKLETKTGRAFWYEETH